jgi:hypothetical protein
VLSYQFIDVIVKSAGPNNYQSTVDVGDVPGAKSVSLDSVPVGCARNDLILANISDFSKILSQGIRKRADHVRTQPFYGHSSSWATGVPFHCKYRQLKNMSLAAPENILKHGMSLAAPENILKHGNSGNPSVIEFTIQAVADYW